MMATAAYSSSRAERRLVAMTRLAHFPSTRRWLISTAAFNLQLTATASDVCDRREVNFN